MNHASLFLLLRLDVDPMDVSDLDESDEYLEAAHATSDEDQGVMTEEEWVKNLLITQATCGFL